MEVEPEHDALFEIVGPDEGDCVRICSTDPRDPGWCHNLGSAAKVARVLSQWLGSLDQQQGVGDIGTDTLPLNESVKTASDLQRIVQAAGGGPYYVYVLRWPSDTPARGAPFYVGIGQGNRLFAHEEEARDALKSGPKVAVIREIWDAGKEVLRTVDSVHSAEPWDREEQLINSVGRLADGTGPLTNAQGYSRSKKVGGVELRKYASDHEITGDVNAVPPKFKLRNVRLMAGPRKPLSRSSVFGKIYEVAEKHPGLTGEELVRLVQHVDFTGNKSAYTQSGAVSASWVAGYIEGAFYRSDRLHLQEYEPGEQGAA